MDHDRNDQQDEREEAGRPARMTEDEAKKVVGAGPSGTDPCAYTNCLCQFSGSNCACSGHFHVSAG